MTQDSVLDAEYRALVRQLHEQTIAIVADVDIWWNLVLFRELAEFTSSLFDREFDEDETRAKARELQDDLQFNVDKKLYQLAFGHPDPDVRRAADVMTSRLFGAVFYYDIHRAKRKDGAEATTAIHLAHNGLTDLKKAAYHAPFRVNRPDPDYNGIRVVEPLASQLIDIPRDEY